MLIGIDRTTKKTIMGNFTGGLTLSAHKH